VTTAFGEVSVPRPPIRRNDAAVGMFGMLATPMRSAP